MKIHWGRLTEATIPCIIPVASTNIRPTMGVPIPLFEAGLEFLVVAETPERVIEIRSRIFKAIEALVAASEEN